MGRSALIVALALLIAASVFAASPPDAFEGCPYDDDSATTTRNVLTETVEQTHTIHGTGDVDWGKCVSTADSGPIPYKLSFYIAAMPPGPPPSLNVAVYNNGLTNPPTTGSFSSLDVGSTGSVTWISSAVGPVYYSVGVAGGVEPQVQHNVTFGRNTGANNGIASGVGTSQLTVKWDTIGLNVSGTSHFNVLRSPTGQAGSFVQVNDTTIPPPVSPGPCPGPGCMSYPDHGLSPATIYYYKIQRVKADTTTEDWTGLFAGYTPPSPCSSIEEWRDYE